MKARLPSLALAALALAALALAAFAAAQAPAPPATVAEALRPFADRGALAGVVALTADRDKTLGLEALGYADVAARAPMKPDALFWIASQSKPITATALMMLVDEGKLALDDPVEKHLPEFHGQWLAAEKDDAHQLLKPPAHPITIREILSHTSGLPFSSTPERPTRDRLPLQAATLTYALTPLLFEPGTRYLYSNAGINTAGRIIEVVSGTPYEAFLQTRLFGPLGMTDTTFRPTPEQLARLAKAYRPSPDKLGLQPTTIEQLHYPLDDPSRQPMPAGGLFSTAADVAQFCRMVLNGGTLDGRRYLSEQAVRAMTTKQTGPLVKEEYGLGWNTAGGTFGHGGAFATNMRIDPKHNLITVFLVQQDGFPRDGSEAAGAFQQAAERQFTKAAR